jgi:hypothetical protein
VSSRAGKLGADRFRDAVGLERDLHLVATRDERVRHLDEILDPVEREEEDAHLTAALSYQQMPA